MTKKFSNILSPPQRRRDVDIIIDYLLQDDRNPVYLSPEQEAKLERMQQADKLLMKYPQSVVVRMLLKMYPEISRAGAYRTCRGAIEVFNTMDPSDRDFGRRLAIKWAFEARDLAIRQRDPKALASAVDKIIKIFGLDKDAISPIDPEKLEQHNYILQLIIKGAGTDESSRAILLNDFPSLPEEKQKVVIDAVHENMGLEDITEIIEEDEAEE